ncbi:uroporphyrinogen-III synthase-like isoform X2 [Macrosteles quadrilineatus]|uniref:uroporphyrinogen-III synthase-like isoform X2 n=1 Tax=Macrosteles quadrilineatus TaxID=74068 RepID=UPI0023E0F816|nr:uroporphyrinogen-III synthase-like isoform X2 [Macrosteles quadrilineatus]
MKDSGKTVFIFRSTTEVSSNDKDTYTEELEKRGIFTKTIPVLDFSFKNLALLNEKLNHPEQFSVGETTACLANECLQINTQGSCTGNGVNLAPIILSNQETDEDHDFTPEQKKILSPSNSGAVSSFVCSPSARQDGGNNQDVVASVDCSIRHTSPHQPQILPGDFPVQKLSGAPSKPLLLPCGNLKMDTLEKLLAEGGVSTEAVEVYETVPHPQLESLLCSALAETVPTHMAFFSPSGIHYSYPILKKLNIDLDKIKWVSIGPTTAAALQSYQLTVHCTADKLTPQCLAQSIASS